MMYKNLKYPNKLFIALICLFFLFACDGPKLFEAPIDTLLVGDKINREGSELMWVHIKGGFAGINERS